MDAYAARRSSTGLVLMGGGARAAYQVGVLRALGRLRREVGAPRCNPFGIIAGTSAGAINAAALACNADRFDHAVAGVVQVWHAMHAEAVYRADAFGVVRTGARWLTMLTLGWALSRWRRARPRSLLDNSPLAELLARAVPLERLPRLLAEGHLDALAVTASSYSSGHHVTFCQTARAFEPWLRSQRVAVQAPITTDHLLASSAIPFVFPAQRLPVAGAHEWFGDGSMRQSAPISPAIHLGAQRVFVVGAGRLHEPPGESRHLGDYPSLAQVAGHALSNIFLDALAVDIERLQRINRTLALLDPVARERSPLRPVQVLVIAPSQRLDDIAARHLDDLPAPVRTLLRGVGVGSNGGDKRGGAALASYLLFEPGYTRELIRLGVADTLARRDEVLDFFGWPQRRLPPSEQDLSPTRWGDEL
ncbi:MAG TPA: patatin-like phospholipase family protein [Burkholderiaceae bacterium]|nr:patatin-like phospholipase family protein [Burkholderiaceae bacterium]